MTLIAEFRNIISNTMRSTLGEISSELHSNLRLADRNIDRVRGIIRDFLDISQIDAGKMKLELTDFSLRSVVSEVIEALSPLAAGKDIELKSFMPDSELVIDADRDKIVRVLTNLVSNAIKTVPPNGHVGVRVKDVGSEIAVEVQDDGPSIEMVDVYGLKVETGKETISALLCLSQAYGKKFLLSPSLRLTDHLQAGQGNKLVVGKFKNSAKAGYRKDASGRSGNAAKNKPMLTISQQLAQLQQIRDT